MIRPTRIVCILLAFIAAILFTTTSCTTSKHGCKLSINKKKLDYYNGLQYRGARKN